MITDPALRTQLMSWVNAGRATGQKGQQAALGFGACQKTAFAHYSTCQSVSQTAASAQFDSLGSDVSGAGASIKGALTALKAKDDLSAAAAAGMGGVSAWIGDLKSLDQQLLAILPGVTAGPIADAIVRASAYLKASDKQASAIRFNPTAQLDRVQGNQNSASKYADEVAADVSPLKGGKNVSASARACWGYLQAMGPDIMDVGNEALLKGQQQFQATGTCNQAVAIIDQLIWS